MQRRFVSLILLIGLFGISQASVASSIGAKFHKETKLSLLRVLKSALKLGSQPSLYKKYKDAKKIKLPRPELNGMPLGEAIKKRRSIRNYSSKPLSLNELSSILFAASGITGYSQGYALRAAPSAGALYPIETYVVVNNVEGLDKGIYHYSVREHSLEFIKEGDYRSEIIGACVDQEMVGQAAVDIVLTAIWARITWKYDERGYRYAYMETGHISQNIYLVATSLGLGSVCIGAFFDDKLNGLLGIDGESESAIYVHAIGKL